MIKAIDHFARERGEKRSEAIRCLVDQALQGGKKRR